MIRPTPTKWIECQTCQVISTPHEYDDKGNSICPDCEGEGDYEYWIPLAHGETDWEMRTCDTCDGTGKGEDCEACQNTGKELVEDIIKQDELRQAQRDRHDEEVK